MHVTEKMIVLDVKLARIVAETEIITLGNVMSVVTLRKIKQSFNVSEEKITAQIVTKN